MVDDVERDAGACTGGALPAQQETVEGRVQDEERGEAPGGEARPACEPTHDQPAGRERAQAMPPAEVERLRAAPAVEQELRPREPPLREVGPHHGRERPGLQVTALEERVEGDPCAARREPQTQLDVLDRGGRVALGVEAADGEERGAADRPETGPE